MYHAGHGNYRTHTYSTFMLLCIAGIFVILILMQQKPMETNYLPPRKNDIVSVYKPEGPLYNYTYQLESAVAELSAIENDVVYNETNQKTSHNNESYQFVNFTDIVRNLTSPVLLTTTNFGYLNLLLNLLYSIQRLSIQPVILILCEDKTAYVELLKRQSNFSLKYHLALTHLQESATDAFTFSTTGYISLVKKRVFYIEILLQRGLDVFYMDSDVVLLADPFNYFTDDNYDIFFQWDRNQACTGFFYMKANRTTKAFVTKWNEAVPGDKFGNQRAFNRAMKKSGKELKVNGLPKDLFMSGYEFRNSGKAWYLMSPQPVQIHANFMRGEGSKVDWLKKHELWFVNV